MHKLLQSVVCLCLLVSPVHAGKGSSGSSRASSWGGSKPSASSKPSISFKSSVVSKPTTNSSTASKSPASSWGGSASKPMAGVTAKAIKPITSFDKLAAIEMRKVESRSNYEKSVAPATSYKSSTGTSVPIKDVKVAKDLHDNLDRSKWINRPTRESDFYEKIPRRMPTVNYNDHYNSRWNDVLLGMQINDAANWIHHHQQTIDNRRLDDLYRSNAELRRKVDELKTKPVDSTWVPPAIDNDLQYSDEFVNASINPEPIKTDDSSWGIFWTILLIFGAFSVVTILMILLFDGQNGATLVLESIVDSMASVRFDN